MFCCFLKPYLFIPDPVKHTIFLKFISNIQLTPCFESFLPLLTGDEKGSIIAWRYTEENLFEACPVQDHIFSVALSYISQGEIAVG